MAIRRDIGSLDRTIIKNIVRLTPAAVLMAATLNSASCGKASIFQQTGGGSSSSATPTPATGALAFVTNFTDGKVSSFTRNTTTGVLKRESQIKAGASGGPKGLIASKGFLYVANNADDNIYQFSINSKNGKLTALSPASVANGSGSGPDELAINSGGTFLWVTNSHNGTVSAYTIDTTTGLLTQNGSALAGFTTPFGIAIHPSLSVLYVADAATGDITPLTIGGNGQLTANFTAVHSADLSANAPGFIAVDPGGGALFVADQVLGEVSTFSIDVTGALTPAFTFANHATTDTPIGIGIATNTSIEFLFTANQGINGSVAGSVSSFVVSGTTLTTPPTNANPYNGPTGLAIDPQAKFVYTANQFDGTVGQSAINGSCGSAICVGSTVATEKPLNANSGPFGIVLTN